MPVERSARPTAFADDPAAIDGAPWSSDPDTDHARVRAACSSERHERRALELARQTCVKSALEDLRTVATELDADAWMYRPSRPPG
ncbi:hypothetical protein BE221DRAFT_187407 [Ostreococcus tauri]|uniref:Uncharacterized protein n=1 Tax=Ostreococcus tauri TaxID=70448 RepID=A0A1Y5HZJ1_OSTTA|nr:hypothetical protein BE221DRAFT_187407 [Ostreococcus tauri]